MAIIQSFLVFFNSLLDLAVGQTFIYIYHFFCCFTPSLQIPQKDNDWREASPVTLIFLSLKGWSGVSSKDILLKRKNEKCSNPSETKGLFFFDLQSSGDRLWAQEMVKERNYSGLDFVRLNTCLSFISSKLLSTHICRIYILLFLSHQR